MTTTKPFSTISYNSIEFLKTKLDILINKNIIYFYGFIFHKKEEDEKRDHIHLLINPNGKVDCDKILKTLEEYDPNNPTLPLRCKPPRKTNSFADWYLYNLHDIDYLKAHGQARKYHYTKEDFITNDTEELDDLIRSIDYRKMYGNRNFFSGLEKGRTIFEMVEDGTIPIQQYNAFANFIRDNIQYNIDRTFRGLNTGALHEHDPLIDVDGVVQDKQRDIQGYDPCSVSPKNTDKETSDNV